MFQNNLLMGAASTASAGGFSIDNSVRYNDDDSPGLTRTNSVGPTDASKGIVGGWFKSSNIGMTRTFWTCAGSAFEIDITVGDQMSCNVDGGYQLFQTNQLFRDPTAWYQVVCSYDSDESSADDRFNIYINGIKITSFSYESFTRITSAEAWPFTADTIEVSVGISYNGIREWDGYLAQQFLLDGVSIQNGDHAITDLAEFDDNGVWRPVDLSGFTFGNNGWLLDFADSSALGNDVSGNDNDFASSGLAADDQMDDTPTKNFCTLNPIDTFSVAGTGTLSNGSLTITTTNTTGSSGTIVMTGKTYWETTCNAAVASFVGIIGNALPTSASAQAESITGNFTGFVNYMTDGAVYKGASLEDTYASWTTSDVMGCAYDPTVPDIEFFKNNVSQGSITLDDRDDYQPWVGMAGNTANLTCNFGQSAFTHTPPTGFKALNTSNLTTPTLTNPDVNFVNINADAADVVSDLATAQSDAGWGSDETVDIYKNREITENWKVRFSDDASNELVLNTDAAKVSNTAFTSGDSYQGFSLRMNSTKGCATGTISHTNGSDTSAAHGISLPTNKAVIMKREDSTGDWIMGAHPALTADYNIVLNTNSSETSTESIAIDASNVIVKSAVATGTYRYLVIPAWDGVVSMGQYVGNANADGPFAYTGQLGTVTMIDGIRTSTASEGVWFFNPSNTANPTDAFFDTPDGSAERTGFGLLIDNLAAGIKPRGTHGSVNQSTRIMGYIQWGTPFGGDGVSPATAF